MSIDLDQLERLAAECPAQGPWYACGTERGGCQCGNVWSVPMDAPITSGMSANKREMHGEGWTDEATFANASFISACDPATVAALVRAVRFLEAAEWTSSEYGDQCITCDACQIDGHHGACALAEVLAPFRPPAAASEETA